MNPKPSSLDADALMSRGYRRVSNACRLVARIDRPDWVEVMANQMRRAPADFYVKETGEVSSNWADHYRRLYSKDVLYVAPEVAKEVLGSGYDSVGYVVDGVDLTAEARRDWPTKEDIKAKLTALEALIRAAADAFGLEVKP